MKRLLTRLSLLTVLILSPSCDFKSPSDFKTPTWFIDLAFPLIQQKYTLDGMIDSTLIFPHDATGMQLVFDSTLAPTTMDGDYLEQTVNANETINESQTAPDMSSITVDTTISFSIPLASAGLYNTAVPPALVTFPNASDQDIDSSVWNPLARAFAIPSENQSVSIPIPIDENLLPAFVSSVDGFVIRSDSNTDSSYFQSTLLNNGSPTNVTNAEFLLLTGSASSPDTLAKHTAASVAKDAQDQQNTLIGDSLMSDAISMKINFGLAETSAQTVTIAAGDSVQINVQIALKITAFDSARVQMSDYALIDSTIGVPFQQNEDSSGVSIYGGTFASPDNILINHINITGLQSTYPFDMGFYLKFENFVSSDGTDSVKIDTTLNTSTAAITENTKIDGWNFVNPKGDSVALDSMTIKLRASISAQSASIPLDGSALGGLTMGITVDQLNFATIDANILTPLPSTEENIDNMPTGFEGMAFTDVKIEFEIMNSISLPIDLNLDIKGVPQFADTVTVEVRSQIDTTGISVYDSAKTLIQLHRNGTTTYYFAQPTDSIPNDSVVTAVESGKSTIVDLLSSNPQKMIIKSMAAINGRGQITTSGAIKLGYKMIAPFRVTMEPMTFVSANESPIEEMDHDTRNKLRNSLFGASLVTDVINRLPVGGQINVLLSNQPYFPLDTTAEMLNVFRDTMVSQYGWNATDELYTVTNCAALSPAIDSIHIFNVLTDSSECVDGLLYLVKRTGSGTDTLISYIDTLMTVILPEPDSLYTAADSHQVLGSVKTPGTITFSSEIDTTKIRLLSDPGNHYTASRFKLNGTNGNEVYLSSTDYIEINAMMTVRLSSTGLEATAPNELVITSPNGGETLPKNQQTQITWKSYGDEITNVDIAYAKGTNPDISDDAQWVTIAAGEANDGSYDWTPENTTGISDQLLLSTQKDSLRIRIIKTDGTIKDINGWYFGISGNVSRPSGKDGSILSGGSSQSTSAPAARPRGSSGMIR